MADIEERPQRSRTRLPMTYRKAFQRAISRLLREDTSSKSSSMALSRIMVTGTSSHTLHSLKGLSVLLKGPRWVCERALPAG